jgi:DNA-binding response OmpR family regulator
VVLVVEPNGWLQAALGGLVQAKGGYVLRGVGSGGEALDLLGRDRFQMAIVAEALPDLPGSMVVRTLKAQSPDTIALLFNAPTDETAGSVSLYDKQTLPFLPQFTDPAQIVERLDELRETYLTTTRERRYVASFRQQHYDLLKRYAELRMKLQRSIEQQAKAG